MKEFDFKIKEILFNNINTKQIVFKNTFWLGLAEAISRVLKFFLFVFIARILGATEYGKFSFAISFVSLFLIFGDLGIFKILTREFAREPEKEKDFPALLSFKIVLSFFTFILILIGSFFITNDFLIRVLIWILGIEVLLNSFLAFFYAFFRARQKMEYQSLFQIINVFLVTIFSFLVLFFVPSVKNLSLGYLAGTFISLFFLITFFSFKIFPLKISFDKKIWKNYFSMSWPLAISAFLGTIYTNIDSTMMGYLKQISQIGWYNAAQKISGIVTIPISLISLTFYPLLSQCSKISKEKFQHIWNYYVMFLFFLIVPAIVGGMTLAKKIIDFIYDPTFFPATLALQILFLATGISILNLGLSQSLVIFDQQKRIFWITLFGAIINIVLNLILIPKFSLYGAAFSTLCTFLLILALTFIFVLKYTELKPLNLKIISFFSISIIASLLMWFIISLPKVSNLYIIWQVTIGLLVYFLCFFLLKIVINYVNKRRGEALILK